MLRRLTIRLLVLALAWFKYRKRPANDPDDSAKVICMMVFLPFAVLLMAVVIHYFAPWITKEQTPYIFWGVCIGLSAGVLAYIYKVYGENRSQIYDQAEEFVRSRKSGPMTGAMVLLALIVGQIIVYIAFANWLLSVQSVNATLH